MPTIRERIASREELFGVFLQLGSPVAADIAGQSGFDWGLIDLEHGSGSESDVVPQLLALAASSVPGFVRVEALSRLRIGRVLDLGAAGVMVPQVNTPEMARQFVEWCRYPPGGTRGVALSARGAGYGRSKHGDVAALDQAVVRIAQIETQAALDAVDEIAAVEGIDVLFIGPTDLTHSMGIPGRYDDPRFGAAIETVAAAAARNDCALGAYLVNLGELDRYRSFGFSFLSVSADSVAMSEALKGAVHSARSASPRPRQ